MATAHPNQSGAVSRHDSAVSPDVSNERNGSAGEGISTLVMSGPSGMEAASRVVPENELILSASFSRMPVALAVAVPVREFRVRHLLVLTPGEVIETSWGHGEDLPLSAAEMQLAWTEFEVVETRLAVRVTRLA